MIRSYPKYAVVMLLFMFINPSFAMGGKVFKLARVFGVGALPTAGLYTAYKRDDLNSFKDTAVVTESAINDWFTEKKKKLNIPNAGSTPLVSDWIGSSWGAYSDKNGGKVIVDPIEKIRLDNALENPHIKENDEYIARNSMILNHEFGHIVHQDDQKIKYVIASVPVCVEAASFGVTKACRKLCNIQQQPKTFMKTLLRSSCTIAAMYPKAVMNIGGLLLYRRYVETQADQFACEHAESRLELEQFAKFFKNLENPEWASKSRLEVRLLEATRDPGHPAPIERKKMIEGYLCKWDKDHAHEIEKRA